MSENLPPGIEEPPIQPASKPERSGILPHYTLELFRDKFAALDLRESYLDGINVWWRTIDRTAAWVKRVNSALSTEELPKEEMEDVKDGLSGIKPAFDEINTSLIGFLKAKPNILKPISRMLENMLPTKEVAYAEELGHKIYDFNEELRGLSTDQVIALCEAVRETAGINDARTMRMKIGQWAFEEMIALFPRIKMWHQYEGIPEPTTVDSLDEEKSELISALRGDLWTPKEIRKWQKVYEHNRTLMGKFRFEEEVKKGFEFLFRSALGEVSPKYSAVQILLEAENVFQGIKDDDTLKDAWDYAADQEEDAEE